MDKEKHIGILQQSYINTIVGSLRLFDATGSFEQAEAVKRKELEVTAPLIVKNFGLNEPKEAFTFPQMVFNCAQWTIEDVEKGFTATAKGCRLCGAAKQGNAPNPCNMYCLDPLKNMIKTLDPALEFDAQETLWEGKQCYIEVVTQA